MTAWVSVPTIVPWSSCQAAFLGIPHDLKKLIQLTTCSLHVCGTGCSSMSMICFIQCEDKKKKLREFKLQKDYSYRSKNA